LKHIRKTRKLALALPAVAISLIMLSVSTASANTAPSLYAPTLTRFSDGSTQVIYTSSVVAGATDYESAWRIAGSMGSYHYSYTPANGFRFHGVNSLMPDNTYRFWVRAIWRNGPRVVYGPWSYPLNVRTYPTWNSISQAVDSAIVQIISPNLSFTSKSKYSYGSGFFVAGQYILTCFHVIKIPWNLKTSQQYYYRVNGGTWHRAILVANNQGEDLALLKPINPAHVFPLSGARWNPPHVGQPVADIGYPLGRTALIMGAPGRISAMHVMDNVTGGVGTLYNLFNANVDAYQGDSGSPVLNHWGQVVGVDDNTTNAYHHFTSANANTTDGVISLATLAQFLDSARKQLGLNPNFFKTY